eukprot:2271580-Prymnesium_polylepis.2
MPLPPASAWYILGQTCSNLAERTSWPRTPVACVTSTSKPVCSTRSGFRCTRASPARACRIMVTFSSQVGRWSALLDWSTHAAIARSPFAWRDCCTAMLTSIHLFVAPLSSFCSLRLDRSICITAMRYFWPIFMPSIGNFGCSDSHSKCALMTS